MPTPVETLAAAAEPFDDIDSPGFARMFDRFGDRRVVLLGEASHGTSEFYRARAAITRRLIEEHGFTIVAVEADWPDAAAVDRHVRHLPPRDVPGADFGRFPTWMWRNTDVAAFLRWLHAHNADKAPEQRVRFAGLDMYNLRASIMGVLKYLDETDPEAAAIARERYGCLSPWQAEPADYGRMALSRGYRACEAAVVAQCQELLQRQMQEDGEGLFDAAQNARLVASAERYYRVMYRGGAESWNLRDQHMFDTLDALLRARGPAAKAVVWAHNSHIGDARHTAMGRYGELNIGQLCREHFGEDAALIGFGTHTGTVAAAHDWGEAMQVMSVRPSLPGSHERLCHETAMDRFLLDFGRGGEAAEVMAQDRPERFIGVVYRPATERQSHYAEAALSRQFDAWVWFDRTSAVTPLDHRAPGVEQAETWPFGL